MPHQMTKTISVLISVGVQIHHLIGVICILKVSVPCAVTKRKACIVGDGSSAGTTTVNTGIHITPGSSTTITNHVVDSVTATVCWNTRGKIY